MVTADGDTEDRRKFTQEMIEKWLNERQEMMVTYCQLAGLDAYPPEKPVKQLLRDFCQLLVDYIAFGHFEVYDRITSGSERRSDVLEVAKRVYPRISEVTEVAVAFNDKYDTSDHDQPLDHLDGDLSSLGEELASRIEKEDQLVAALMR